MASAAQLTLASQALFGYRLRSFALWIRFTRWWPCTSGASALAHRTTVADDRTTKLFLFGVQLLQSSTSSQRRVVCKVVDILQYQLSKTWQVFAGKSSLIRLDESTKIGPIAHRHGYGMYFMPQTGLGWDRIRDWSPWLPICMTPLSSLVLEFW